MQTYFECPKDCPFFNGRKSESSDGKRSIEINFCLRYNQKLQGNGRSWRLGSCVHDEGICTNCGSKTWVRKSDDEILFKEQGFVDGYKCTRCKVHTDFREILRTPVPQAHLTLLAQDGGDSPA